MANLRMWIAVLVLASCSNNESMDIDTAGSEPMGFADDECRQVGVTELRRLTARQYDNTVRDLLGLTSSKAASFSADEHVGPFRSNVISAIGELQAEQYMNAAETIAFEAVGQLEALLPCDPADVGDRPCAQQLIAELGPKAYRRALREQEAERLLAVYDVGDAEDDFANGIRLVIAALLQSPHFLYLVEFGRKDEGNGAIAPLTDHEVATRLSYFLWDTMPDTTLFAAANAGELTTNDGISVQVDRMLADPRARTGIASFHLQWFGVDELETVEKDPRVYPEFTPALAVAMKAETAAFANGVVLDAHGTIATLLTSELAFTEDSQLLTLYGVTHSMDQGLGIPVPLPLDQRAGLLTQASVMARHAHAEQSSPVHRGKFVRENLLCQILPSPPPDVDNTPPNPDPSASTRERFEQHRADPACAACHDLIDGLGFGFEHYDAIGRWRDLDGIHMVDASGWIVGTDVDGEFDGIPELAARLAESTIVAECTTRQWFRFALGRGETLDDTCTIDSLARELTEGDGSIEGLIHRIAVSQAFRSHRAAPIEPQPQQPRGDER